MFGRKWFTIMVAGLALISTLWQAGMGTAAASPTVAEPFVAYYNQHQGLRVLGHPLSDLTQAQGYLAQYFEKGRIEDHRGEVQDPNWAFMYGRLTAELIERDPEGTVSSTSISYGYIGEAADPNKRQAPPKGFTGGIRGVHDGMFVPFDSQLRPAPGYVVAPYFWAYINRADLFPGGWLHDAGLPLTDVFNAQVTKSGESRTIFMQAFERAVLSYDMRNPAGWQVEKANIGADAFRLLPPLPPSPEPAIQVPTEGAQVMLPLHLLARLGRPGERVTAELRWQDGTKLTNTFTALRGEGGNGLVIGNLDWVNMPAPPRPKTQPATLELRSTAGAVVARRQLTIVGANDPNTTAIGVWWTVSGTELVQPQIRRVIKTGRIAAAALEELLWGPPAISQVGFGTALPTPQDVLSYPGRQPDWGPRVTLLGVKIENGVATADFSKELRAYGGGSLRVKLIHDQIAQTLKQFPTVREVRIAIEGQTDGVLEP